MPYVIPLIAAVAAQAITNVWVRILVVLAVDLLSEKLLTPKAPKVRTPIGQEYTSTVAPRRIIYGRIKTSGMNVIPPVTTGVHGDYLHQVLAIAGHECAGIDEIYFNQSLISTEMLDGSGNIISGEFANRATIRKYRGNAAQTSDSILMLEFPGWNTSHRGVGICYLALRYQFDTGVYASGKPEITAIVRGKLVYDPRIDTSPGAHPVDPLYQAYSTNPALCLADYLISSMGLDETPTRVDWNLVAAAANICDEQCDTPLGLQTRYTCNCAIDATTDYEAAIAQLAKAMMGVCYYSGGKWRVYAGAWTAPAFALTDDDLAGAISIQTAQSRKGTNYYNFVRGQYTNPNENYQLTEFRPIAVPAYEEEDGERIPLDVEYPTCTAEYEAQRNAIMQVKVSRRQKIVTAVYALSAFRVRPYETGTVTISEIGWINQTVRCIGWRFRPEPVIELVLQEAGAGDYNDPLVEDYVEPDETTPPAYAAYVPPAPQIVAIGAHPGFIEVDVIQPTPIIASVETELWASQANDRNTAAMVQRARTNVFKHASPILSTFYFWARNIDTRTGEVSEFDPSTTTTIWVGSAVNPGNWTPKARNSCYATVSTIEKVGGVAAYDSDCYSLERFATGAFLSFRANQTDKRFLVGFAIDADAATGIDDVGWGWECAEDGHAYVTEAGTHIFDAGTYNTNAVFSQIYDGADVTYYLDGILKHTTPISPMIVQLSAWFYSPGAKANDVKFGVTAAGVGPTGPPGPAAIIVKLSRYSVSIIAYGDGTPVTLEEAHGQCTVYQGDVDVTAAATLSVYIEEGCAGTINSAANTPVAGKPKGYYEVTAVTADLAVLTFLVTVGQQGFTADFVISRIKAGIQIVDALPTQNLFEGRIVYLTTTDGAFAGEKLYRYTGSEWTAAVPAVDITGQIADAQIAALAASKITGQMNDSQLAAIAAAKVTGQLVDSQLAAIAASKLTGSLGGGNVCRNSSFESDVDGDGTADDWVIYNNGPESASISLPSSGGIFNGKFQRITFATNTSEKGVAQNLAVPGNYQLNQWYVLSWYARASGGAIGKTMRNHWNADSPTEWIALANPPLTTDWQRYVYRQRWTSGVPANQIYISIMGAVATSATLDIDAVQIELDTLTAYAPMTNEVLPGTISAEKIAAGAITASKMVIAGGTGAALNPDPSCFDDSAWTDSVGSHAVIADVTAPNGRALRAISSAGSYANIFSLRFPITAGKRYRCTAWVKLVSGGGNIYLRPWITDTSDALVAYNVGVENVAPTSSYVRMGGSITAPSNAVWCRMAVWANYFNYGPGEVRFADPRIEEVLPGELIVDGAITASKIASGTITSSQIATDTITASNIAAGAIGASELSAGSVSTSHLAAFAVQAGNIAAGAIQAGKIAAGVVSTNELAASAVTADKIMAGQVTLGKLGADSVIAANIQAGAIQTAHIQAGAITAASAIIADAAITSAKIGYLQVDEARIANLNVSTGKIANNAVTDMTSQNGAPFGEPIYAGTYQLVGFYASTTGGRLDVISATANAYAPQGFQSNTSLALYVDGVNVQEMPWQQGAYTNGVYLYTAYGWLIRTLSVGTHLFQIYLYVPADYWWSGIQSSVLSVVDFKK